MTPKLEEEISEAGSPYVGWLSRLNASARNFRTRRSVIGVCFFERRIDFVIAVSTPNVPSEGPPHTKGGYREDRRIEPVIDRLMGRVNGDAGNQVWLRILGNAVGQVRRFDLPGCQSAGQWRPNAIPAQRPAAHQLSHKTAIVQETLARAKRKVVNSIGRSATGKSPHLVLETAFELFVQDQFRPRPNVSPSVGLRYDRQNYIHEKNNFAPRVALAFSPDSRRKTVIRAGAGTFYERSGNGPVADLLRFDGAHLLPVILSEPTYPDPLVPVHCRHIPSPELSSPQT